MYGFPQAGLLTNQLLKKRRSQYGFHPTKITPGLWTHEIYIYIQFTLVVDEFGIQYNNKQYFQYLIKSLQ